MSGTRLWTHGVTKIAARLSRHSDGDTLALTIIDRKGEELEVLMFADSSVTGEFAALAKAVREIFETPVGAGSLGAERANEGAA